MQETQVQSLGQECPLKRKQQPTLVLFAWEIHPMGRVAWCYSPWGCKNLTQLSMCALSILFLSLLKLSAKNGHSWEKMSILK